MEFFDITNEDETTILKFKNNYEIIYNNDNNDNTIKIKKKIIIITDIEQISSYLFTNSTILSCKIDNEIIDSPNYNRILKIIYNKINDGVKIIKTTTFNMRTIKYENEGFYYLSELGISYQGRDSNGTIKEIFTQSKEHNITIKITIKLLNNTIVSIEN
jgi:hypothetical protein